MPHTAILHDMSNYFKKYAKKLLRMPKNVKIVGFRNKKKCEDRGNYLPR